MAKKPAKKSGRATATKEPAQTPDEVVEEAAAAKAAEKEAEEARKAEIRDGIRSGLADTLETLQASDQQNAIEARLSWVKIGDLLIEGQQGFMNDNKVNDKEYGRWLISEGFTALGQRPTRASAVWLANVHNVKPDLYALFPTEPSGDEPLRRSPRTLQAWVRDRIYEAFQSAFETDPDMAIPSEVDKDKRSDTAVESMPNVYEVVDDMVASFEEAVDRNKKAIDDASTKETRKRATEEYNIAHDMLDHWVTTKEILNQHTDEERLDLFMRWKPKRAIVAFKDLSIEDAAAKLMSLLKTHEEFASVYEALGDLVEDHVRVIAAEEAAVEDETSDESDEEVEEAEDEAFEEEEDFDEDDFDEDGEEEKED